MHGRDMSFESIAVCRRPMRTIHFGRLARRGMISATISRSTARNEEVAAAGSNIVSGQDRWSSYMHLVDNATACIPVGYMRDFIARQS